jgi:hypothetical protein
MLGCTKQERNTMQRWDIRTNLAIAPSNIFWSFEDALDRSGVVGPDTLRAQWADVECTNDLHLGTLTPEILKESFELNLDDVTVNQTHMKVSGNHCTEFLFIVPVVKEIIKY